MAEKIETNPLIARYEHAQKNNYSKWATGMSGWLEDRQRAQRDLFWLAKNVFEMDLIDNFVCFDHPSQMSPDPGTCVVCKKEYAPCPGLTPGVSFHREICNAFVRKNPDLSIANQDTVKERLIMVSRGGFKSTLDEIDCIQWIVCFPDIRIAVWTATEDLGVSFVSSIRKRFIIEGKKDGEKTYTRFQLLFPEFCIPAGKKEEEGSFLSPARKKELKDPTVIALSLGQSTSGIHTDVGKYDDCVDNRNSGPGSTVEQRQTVYNQIRLTRGVIEPYGYRDYIGTPYDEIDAYSMMMEKANPDKFKILLRPAWAVKKEFKATPLVELQEHMVDLLFPFDSAANPRLNFSVLKDFLNEDEYIFCCQYLCSPSSKRSVNFTEQLLTSHITQEEGLPQAGSYRTFSAWDFASSTGRSSDFSCGAVGFFDVIGRMFVVEVEMGRFSKSELARKVAEQAARWKVEHIRVEKSPGADYLETDIRNELKIAGHPSCPLEFFKVDSTKDAKESRALGLETLLTSNRLWFSSLISCWDALLKQFKNFKPHSKRKDDCVDCIAHLARFLPDTIEVPQSEQDRQEEVWKILRQKQLLDMIYVPPIQEVVEEPPPAATHYEGLPIFMNLDEQLYGR